MGDKAVYDQAMEWWDELSEDHKKAHILVLYVNLRGEV